MLKVPSELGRVRLLPAAWLQTGKMRPSGWQKASTRGMLLQLLCITCLIAAARAGVDSQGEYALALLMFVLLATSRLVNTPSSHAQGRTGAS